MAATKCAKCGASLSPAQRFCGICGTPVAEQPAGAAGLWERRPGEIAARVDFERGGFWDRGEVRVGEGTKALLLSRGELIGELAPGGYSESRLKGLIGATPHQVHLIAYDAGDISLALTVRDVFTVDPVRLDVDCQVVVRIDDARLFVTNVIKSNALYTEGDLRGLVYEELHNGFQEHLSRRKAAELSGDLDHKHEVEVSLSRHLAETLRRDGLEVIQLRTLRYRHERLDRQRGVREEIVLGAAEAEIALEGRQRRFEALARDEQQAIIEASAEAERLFERNRVRARLREALGGDRMDELRAKDGLEAFELEMGKSGMLRDDERETLRRTLEERRGDAEMTRRHLVEKLDLEHQAELARIARLEEIEIGRLQDDYENERDERDLTRGMEALRQLKALQREKADAEAERTLRVERERGLIEAERLRALSQVSTEALIATSGAEQAKILADLKRTETLASLSEERILALAAENSPEVAKAFQERFRSLGTDKITELYERMLADRDRTTAALHATQSEALGAIRDVAAASTGRQGAGGGARGSSADKVVVCSRCRVEVAVGQKHCSNCGAEMF